MPIIDRSPCEDASATDERRAALHLDSCLPNAYVNPPTLRTRSAEPNALASGRSMLNVLVGIVGLRAPLKRLTHIVL